MNTFLSICLKSTVLLTTLVAATVAATIVLPKPSLAGTASCYQVRDPDGWSNVRNLRSNAVVGRFYTGTTFLSAYATHNSRILGGLGNQTLKVSISRSRLVNMSECDNRYWVTQDRDGFVNLRSAPGSTIMGRIGSGITVMRLESSGEWTRILTSDDRFGYVHNSRLTSIHHLQFSIHYFPSR